MLLCYNNHIENCAKKYVDAIEQNALSRRVKSARGAMGGGSMVHRLDFDMGLHQLAAADGGGSGDYPPLAATNLCQSSQCHIQLSVDCHSSCMNGDIWR